MLFIRMFIYLAIIIAILPSGQHGQYSLYKIVTSTAHDFGDFCNRNPETCKQTSNAFESFKEKAKFAGKSILGLFSQKNTDLANVDDNKSFNFIKKATYTQTPEAEGDTDLKQSDSDVKQDNGQNTLNSEDLQVEWLEPENKENTSI